MIDVAKMSNEYPNSKKSWKIDACAISGYQALSQESGDEANAAC